MNSGRILAYTNSVTTTYSRKVSKNFQLISFNFSQRIHSNGHALTVGCLISMRNLCMKLMDSNIQQIPSYGVHISQLVRYARICSRKDDFIYRHRLLSLKLQQQCNKYQQLMKSFHKFYRSHSDELKKFGTTLMELRSSI